MSKRKPGRPPSGPADVRVSKYPQLTIRVPPACKARLEALSAVRGLPMWKLVEEAADACIAQLPEAERRLVFQVAALREKAGSAKV